MSSTPRSRTPAMPSTAPPPSVPPPSPPRTPEPWELERLAKSDIRFRLPAVLPPDDIRIDTRDWGKRALYEYLLEGENRRKLEELPVELSTRVLDSALYLLSILPHPSIPAIATLDTESRSKWKERPVDVGESAGVYLEVAGRLLSTDHHRPTLPTLRRGTPPHLVPLLVASMLPHSLNYPVAASNPAIMWHRWRVQNYVSVRKARASQGGGGSGPSGSHGDTNTTLPGLAPEVPEDISDSYGFLVRLLDDMDAGGAKEDVAGKEGMRWGWEEGDSVRRRVGLELKMVEDGL